jgi:preprotein translocase subunit SecG
MIFYILLTIFMIVCLVMIGVILLQRSRGGGLAGAFGGGGSDTMLGSLQSSELVKFTTYLAIGFFVLAIAMDFFPPQRRGVNVEEIGTVQGAGQVQTSTTPSEPGTVDEAMPADLAPVEVEQGQVDVATEPQSAEQPATGGGEE